MDGKWHCKSCTFINHQKSSRCVLCSASKYSSKNVIERVNDIENKINGLQVTVGTGVVQEMEVLAETAASVKTAVVAQGSSSMESCEPSVGGRNEFGQPFKWICSQCTYENWPKSRCCVLCGATQLGLTSMEMTELEPEKIEEKGKNLRNQKIELDQERSEVEQTERPKLKGKEISPKRAILEAQSLLNDSSEELTIKKIKVDSGNASGKGKIISHFGDENQAKRLLGCLESLDWKWINACISAVHGNVGFIEEYFDNGGDIFRTVSLTDMVVLKYLGNFKVGFTLFHVALWNDSEIAKCLPTPFVKPAMPRIVPGNISNKKGRIFRHISTVCEQPGGTFPCTRIQDTSTFYLPREIDELSSNTQTFLWNDLLDHNALSDLDSTVINWDPDIIARGSKLFVLWNRNSGDCVLDSVLQCTYGVFDDQNTLRFILADALRAETNSLYAIWKEDEIFQANELCYSLGEKQLAEEWAKLLNGASIPGSSLEPFHIFVLAHILCRPIIVYGEKYIKGFHGDYVGLARFEGIYLPTLCDIHICSQSPIALGYTRGHISALVFKEPAPNTESGKGEDPVFLLPLVDQTGSILPVQFMRLSGDDEIVMVLKRWLDIEVTDKGAMVAKQVPKLYSLVSEMVYDWLAHYKLM